MSDMDLTLVDTRTVERKLAAGLITRADYDAWLAGLEDDADRAVDTDTRFTHGVVTGTIKSTGDDEDLEQD